MIPCLKSVFQATTDRMSNIADNMKRLENNFLQIEKRVSCPVLNNKGAAALSLQMLILGISLSWRNLRNLNSQGSRQLWVRPDCRRVAENNNQPQ